jgi:two-component system response regulator AtoC
VVGLCAPAAEKLTDYSWQGNVRELRNCIESAVALTDHEKILVEDLPEKIRAYKKSELRLDAADPERLQSMEEVERRYIEYVLHATVGNKTNAAQILGFDRKTLYRKLEKYKIADPED